MLTVIASSENSNTISIPADEMKRLGFSDGEEVEIFRENGNVILRSATETERKRKFETAKNKIFEEWNDVFVALAKGADDETPEEMRAE